MKKYNLEPDLGLIQYANGFYVFDSRLTRDPFVRVPTRRVEKPYFHALQTLLLNHLKKVAMTEQEIRDLLHEHSIQGDFFRDFVQQHLLLQQPEAQESPETRIVNQLLRRFDSASTQAANEAFQFNQHPDADLHYAPHTFFNLPEDIDSEACTVGLVGLPIATLMKNLGSLSAPDELRAMTRSIHWLKIFHHGFYGEVAMPGHQPEILCKNLAIKDFGNIRFEGKSLSEIFETLQELVKDIYFQNKVRPIFIGGDHALTYPVVDAFSQKIPNLHLIHLDGHNDLFYAKKFMFRDSAPISNLVRFSNLARIFSFGLRTFHDERARNYESLDRAEALKGKVCMHSLLQTKRLIHNEDQMAEVFRPYKRYPFYLTIDLDVLSASAIGNQVSTPIGEGLEWHELLYFLHFAFRELDIIACDITEFNSLAGSNSNATGYYLRSLLLEMMDGLAGKAPAK